jgi:hypothetical protein
VDDDQLGFSDDGEVVLEEQVVVDMDAAADRILDRKKPMRRPAFRHRGKYLFESIARDDLGAGPRLERRGLAVRS